MIFIRNYRNDASPVNGLPTPLRGFLRRRRHNGIRCGWDEMVVRVAGRADIGIGLVAIGEIGAFEICR